MVKKYLITLIAVAVSLSFVAASFSADKKPVRSGEVVEVVKSGIWNWIGVKDNEGKMFWIMASNCTVSEGGKIELLEGEYFKNIKLEKSGRVLENCYSGRLIRLDGLELEAYGAHGLPSGCIDLGPR